MYFSPADPGKSGRHRLLARKFPGIIVIALLFLLISSQGYAQGSATVRYETKIEDPVFRPYLVGYFGLGEPDEAAYGQVFSDPLFRVGGGFGMRIYDFGVEVLIRRGGIEKTHLIINEEDYQFYRNFYFSTTEIQLKFYGAPRFGKFSIPAGVGFGMTNTTVDRGYSGEYDRFSGTGFYVGPFAGIEYQVNESFNVSIEVEYAMSQASFSGNEVWHSLYGVNAEGQITSTETDFWDTVGGLRDTDFDGGGIIGSIKLTIFIPTFVPDK